MKAIRAPDVRCPERDQSGPDAEHDASAHAGEELDEREVGGHQALSADPGLEVVAAQPVEAGHRLALVHEGLGLAHARTGSPGSRR